MRIVVHSCCYSTYGSAGVSAKHVILHGAGCGLIAEGAPSDICGLFCSIMRMM